MRSGRSGEFGPDEFGPDDIRLDASFIEAGPREASAEERIAQAARIARANDRLRAQGEIADGTGKPGSRRRSRTYPWIVLGALIGGAIVVLALIAR